MVRMLGKHRHSSVSFTIFSLDTNMGVPLNFCPRLIRGGQLKPPMR